MLKRWLVARRTARRLVPEADGASHGRSDRSGRHPKCYARLSHSRSEADGRLLCPQARGGHRKGFLGVAALRGFFDQECDQLGSAPPVVDAADVLADPAGTLSALCEAMDIPWTEAMIAGPPAVILRMGSGHRTGTAGSN